MSGSRAMMWLLTAGVAWVAAAGRADGQTPGRITEVRVYRGQALVVREVSVEAKAGPQELVVTDLPAHVVPDSLHAAGEDGLSIQAVRYRTRAVADAPREEVRALDEQIARAQDKLAQIETEMKILAQHSGYLDKLEAYKTPTAQVELTEGAIRTKDLIEFTAYVFKQREQIARQQLAHTRDQEKVTEILSVLRRERAKLTAGGSKTRREAVVFVDAARAGRATLSLNYLVDHVSWSPAYTARLNGARDRITLDYQAVVTQMSGEDWNGVSLTLSTSHPRMLAESPVLSPLWVSLTSGAQGAQAVFGNARDYVSQQRQLSQQIRGEGQQGKAGRRIEQLEFDSNVFAARLQNLELAASDEVIRTSRRVGAGGTEGLAVDYPLDGPVRLASRSDQQMFRIARLELKATFYYTAVPLLSDYVYQAAEATNASQTPLLPGPYTAYMNGAFAGRGHLPLIARGQGLTVGFGTETQLRASRELEQKTTELRGGNKIQTHVYRLRLQNYMDRPVKVRVWDRLPQAPDSQVAVTLAEPDPPLSSDPLYVDQGRPRGLLRWDVEVPAGAAGARSFSFTYQFQLEFDRKYGVGELAPAAIEKMQRDLRELRYFQMQ